MDVCVDMNDFKFIQNDPVTREKNELQMAVNEIQALLLHVTDDLRRNDRMEVNWSLRLSLFHAQNIHSWVDIKANEYC